MKIREDFVTNSSSSSYIIAYKAFPNLDDKLLQEFPILKGFDAILERVLLSADDYGDTTEGECIRSVEELEKYFVDCYGYADLNTLQRILDDDHLLKFFQIATPDDDPDNWRSKKEEAEQEAEMAIVRPIITKIDDHVKAYLNANENEASARKALIEVVKKYVKDGNKPTADYMNYLTDPTVAGELLEELQKQFPIEAKKKSVAKKEGNA